MKTKTYNSKNGKILVKILFSDKLTSKVEVINTGEKGWVVNSKLE